MFFGENKREHVSKKLGALLLGSMSACSVSQHPKPIHQALHGVSMVMYSSPALLGHGTSGKEDGLGVLVDGGQSYPRGPGVNG